MRYNIDIPLFLGHGPELLRQGDKPDCAAKNRLTVKKRILCHPLLG
jgi:hypothetical protein